MSNIADHYIELIPSPDWLQLLQLAVENDPYITNIIDTDPKPSLDARKRPARPTRVLLKPSSTGNNPWPRQAE